MNSNIRLARLTNALVIFVIIVHMMFFLLEAIFWMIPEVHNILLVFLDNKVNLNYDVQAVVLKNLFVNQGFYNFFLVCAGIEGLFLVKTGKYSAGFVLILFLCFAGAGAGIILALSTKAYILAFFQGVPAAITFILIYPLFKTSLTGN